MSGTMTSTPRVAASGNIIPQSMTIAASPYSTTMRFMPISLKPPRGMMRRGVLIAVRASRFAVRKIGETRIADRGSRVNPIQHPRIRNRLAQMRQARDPGDDALHTHAEAGMRERSVLANVEIPLKRLDGQVLLAQALQQQVVVVNSLRAADDLAVSLGRNHVQRQSNCRILRIRLHVERLDGRWISADHHRPVECIGDDRLLVAAEVVAELDGQPLSREKVDRLAVRHPRKGSRDMLELGRVALESFHIFL